jgi:electron transport complex protein RnfE
MAGKPKSNFELVLNGLFNENPIFRLALSMCPAVGISTTLINGFLLGLAVLFVQVASSCTISLLKNYIHPKIRIPIYTLVIATWVTVIDLTLSAFFPTAYKAMGIFIRLIVTFSIILMRLEVFAAKNPLIPSFWDGFGMGLGFMFGMMTLGFIRELLGAGALFGHQVLPSKPLLFFILPVAGFFCVGFMMAVYNYVEFLFKRAKEKKMRG